jgi:hypothetical protein
MAVQRSVHAVAGARVLAVSGPCGEGEEEL